MIHTRAAQVRVFGKERFRQDMWFKGEWGDTTVYALLAAEWRDRER